MISHRLTITAIAPFLGVALLLLAAVADGAAAADEIEIQASVDRGRVSVGETFMLNVEVIGTQQARRPRLDALEGFDISYLGSTRKFSMVNGKVSAQTDHRFMLTARKPGRYNLGPFEVPHEGRVIKGGRAFIEVVSQQAARRSGPAGGESKPPDLVLELLPAKTEFWVGEKVSLRIQFSAGNVEVQGLDYPRLLADQITVDPFSEPTRRTVRVGGVPRRFLDFETSMIAVRPGTVTLGPVMIDVTVSEQNPRDRGRSFGGFSLGLRQRKTVELRSEPVELTVRALPGDGRPEDFSGAVGSFEFDVEVSPGAVAAGDPVTVRTLISGAGNLSGVHPPVYADDDSLRTYDPLPAPEEDLPETLVTEQIVIPRRDGDVELPALTFGFFDPAAGEYRTIVRGPFPISVAAPERSRSPAVFASRRDESGLELRAPRETLGRDIVYIKDRPGRSGRRRPLAMRPVFAMGIAFPLLIYVGASLYVRRRERLASDPRIGRYRRAGKDVRRRLGELGGVDAGFHDELTAAVAEYLRAKLDLPPGAVDSTSVLAALDSDGIEEGAREAAARFFEKVEHVRYAGPGAGASDREAALGLARALVDAMEGRRALARRIGIGAVVLLLLLGMAGAARAAQPVGASLDAADPVALFFEGNSAYGEGDYARAADRYQRAIEAGGGSGGLYFNLGNAYFKQSQLGMALLNYERARRVLPRDPDVETNREFARETAGTARVRVPVAVRVAFPLAGRATADELTVVVLGVWWLLAVLLVARALVPSMRRGLGQASWAVGVFLLFATVNLGYRLTTVELVDVVVVVVPGGAVARYEPSAAGVEYFEAAEGEVLMVRDRREGWLKLRRDDGLRGWVATDAVAEL